MTEPGLEGLSEAEQAALADELAEAELACYPPGRLCSQDRTLTLMPPSRYAAPGWWMPIRSRDTSWPAD